MADVTYNISGFVSKGVFSEQFNASAVTADMSTAGLLSVTLALNTSSTQISTASLGALGLAFVRNLATVATHSVVIGKLEGTTVYDAVRVNGGEAALFRLAPGSYAAKAAVSGTTRVVITIFEN